MATPLDDQTLHEHVDTAFHAGGLLVRAFGYAFVYAVADDYDCGRALLTGVLLGDLVSRGLALAWEWRDGLLTLLGELLLLAIVYAFVHRQLVWPEDPAQRAILCLAAFGVFAGTTGRSLFTRLGPSENGFV